MKILVVDDDPELLPLIAFALRQAGYLAIEARSGERALRLLTEERPDLVVLDVNLPDVDGFHVCGAIRAAGDETPVLMLTVRGNEEDVVRGLDEGADDYLTKPFSPRTLLARVRALLRRAGMERGGRVAAGDVQLDPAGMTARIGRTGTVRLTPLEFRLLQSLVASAGRPVPSDTILHHVWGGRAEGDRQYLKQLVHRLRQKIEDDPARPCRLCTEPGIGYRLAVQDDANDGGDRVTPDGGGTAP